MLNGRKAIRPPSEQAAEHGRGDADRVHWISSRASATGVAAQPLQALNPAVSNGDCSVVCYSRGGRKNQRARWRRFASSK